jgi:hypothetical protein
MADASTTVSFRVTKEQREALERAAAARGQSLTEFLRGVAEAASRAEDGAEQAAAAPALKATAQPTDGAEEAEQAAGAEVDEEDITAAPRWHPESMARPRKLAIRPTAGRSDHDPVDEPAEHRPLTRTHRSATRAASAEACWPASGAGGGVTRQQVLIPRWKAMLRRWSQ